jgi:hypothetical protein
LNLLCDALSFKAVPLWSGETTPQGSASLLSNFCIVI